jgi:hypothetical protein
MSSSSFFHLQRSCYSISSRYRRKLITSRCEHSKALLTTSRYGPFTLVAAAFLGLAAYSSARTSLKELVPWLPLALCLFVLLTVYFFPRLRQSLSGNNEEQISMEEGRTRGFYGTPVEPGSIQSEEEIQSRRWNPQVDHWLEHDTSHTGGRDIERPGSSGRLSARQSDIDLDDRQTVPRLFSQRMISPGWQVYNMSNLPRTASDSGFPTQRFAATRPSSRLELSKACTQRSMSQESILLEDPSSTSKEPAVPLRG